MYRYLITSTQGDEQYLSTYLSTIVHRESKKETLYSCPYLCQIL